MLWGASLEDCTLLPDPGCRWVRTDALGITPSVEGKEARTERGSNMHRTAVDADDPRCPAHESREFAEGGLV